MMEGLSSGAETEDLYVDKKDSPCNRSVMQGELPPRAGA